jgi:hypothetical protein
MVLSVMVVAIRAGILAVTSRFELTPEAMGHRPPRLLRPNYCLYYPHAGAPWPIIFRIHLHTKEAIRAALARPMTFGYEIDVIDGARNSPSDRANMLFLRRHLIERTVLESWLAETPGAQYFDAKL